MKFSPVHININKDNILQIQVIWTINIANIEDNITGQIALNHEYRVIYFQFVKIYNY
jgi:hypothetical protein